MKRTPPVPPASPPPPDERPSSGDPGGLAASAGSGPEFLVFERADSFRQILDALDDMVLVKAGNARIVWANRAFRDYYAMSNEQLREIVDAPFNEEENTKQYVQDDHRVYSTGQTLRIPVEPVTRHDGQVNLFNTVKSAIRDEAGTVRLTVGVSRNITEQKRIERKLAEHREHLEVLVGERTAELSQLSQSLQAIIASLDEGIVAVDRERRVTLLNAAAESLLGVSTAAVAGRPVGELLADFEPQPEEVTSHARAEGAHQGAPSGRRFVGRVRAADGTIRLVSFGTTELVDAEGRREGAVLVLRDVTLERELEDERLRHQKLESIGLLAGGIAHDFNNILMGIQGNVSLCREDFGGSEELELALEQAEQSCIRAQGLARQLLTFAKGGEPKKQPVDLAGLARQTAELALRGSTIALQFACEPGVLPVDADEGQLEQVLNNLVLNAKQAMPTGGQVTISIANVAEPASEPVHLSARPYVKLWVEDSGPGIADEHLARVFDPYFTTKSQGSGLGLTSVHSVLRRHEGHISVSSRLGHGARFTLYLPALDAPLAREPSRSNGAHESRKVLLLDDDGSVRQVLRNMLVRLGQRVVVAARSDEALEAIAGAHREHDPVEVAFIDLTMPGDRPGEEVLAELQQLNPRPQLVAMSGYSTSPTIAQFEQRGLDGALTKPFNLAALEAVLERLERAKQG